jgi:hypothetical protein
MRKRKGKDDKRIFLEIKKQFYKHDGEQHKCLNEQKKLVLKMKN